MRIWMRLIPAVLLILASTSPRIYAVDPELTIKKEDFQKLVDEVKKLQNEVKDNSLRGSQTAEEMRAIREELTRIRQLLETMAQQQGAIQRQAGYGPTPLPSGPPAALPAAGTVTVQNVYSAPATVWLNGQAYRVDPGQSRQIVGVPSGTIQYSVDVEGFGMIEPLRTDVMRTGSYRINIFPRMPPY